MLSNKRYIYNMLMRNSKSYWKFLIGYVILLLLLFEISDFAYGFTTTEIILSIVYIVCLWVITVWLTVFFLKKLFSENKFLSWNIFDKIKDSINTPNELDKSNILELSKNIETQFINTWYNEISSDATFSIESRILIQKTLGLLGDIVHSTEKRTLSFAISNIYLKHLKEFRRTLKIKEKNGAKISELYRYSYSTICTKKSRDYYIHQMTKNMMTNFIHWDLWNSIPCHLVVSIVSSKIAYLIDLFSNPDFLNYYLLRSLLSQEQINELNLDKYSFIKIEVTKDNNEQSNKRISRILIEEEHASQEDIFANNVEKDQVGEIEDDAVPDSVYKICNEQDLPKNEKDISEDISFTLSEQVKVYEPKSATKTWSEALDLESITLGEDPLGNSVSSENSVELDDLLRNNIVPGDATANTLRDIKDFQENTVNTVVKPVSHATSQALHKIGDLQDEAAGVVEGLFDFGMAGLRKGLKLTGLQEQNAQEGTVSENKVKNLLSSPGVRNSSNKKINRLSKAELAEECVWVNPLQANTNIDEDVVEEHGKLENLPSILTDNAEFESPDPEYEEAADLATTIAKLRSLLQQKSSESTATTPVASPMISDDQKSVIDMDEVDSFVPSFYKLCAKTATGVINNTLNTIKTALPVNAEELMNYALERWDYEDKEEQEINLLTRMNKLLNDRKDFCVIETAYDAFDSQQPHESRGHISAINFQDELDEFESKVPLAKTLLDIICELIVESDTFISQEPFVKFVLLVLGQSIDEAISTKVSQYINNVSITEIPTDQNNEVLTMELDVFLDYLVSGIPDALTFIIGQSTLKDAMNILVSSIQVKKCNQDVILQIFEFISLRLMEESSKTNLVYSP